jgi:signal transduction histidine kinase/CheY-like chemotaxis protein
MSGNEAAPPVPDAAAPSGLDGRVVFLAATARDGTMTSAMLAAEGVDVAVCRTFPDLLREARAGAGALLMPEEASSPAHNEAMRRFLAEQPPWSDIPVLVLTRPGADSVESSEVMATFGNVTLLERPVRVATLLSAIRTALRARERQYQLRRHLAERALAEESLRLADQRKDEFLATLGHELRNPLAPLQTALHLLKASDLRDPLARRVSAVMDRQVGYLVRLVDDLLEVSRITRGQVQVRSDVIELSTVVQAAIDTSRPAIDAARHELRVDLPPRAVYVRGDAVRLTQVFANLLINAAKYTDDGGHLAVTIRVQDGRAQVGVRDDGIGLSPDQLRAVFDMFTQVDRSSRRAQGGLGIGLTLVRSMVAMHGGTVEARSEGLGRGSEFVVELPVVDGAAHRDTAGALPAAFPRRRILVVDDNRDAAETLRELLETLGASVCTAHSGAAALEAVRTWAPDAVLLDLGMPGMDGFEVARVIRSSPQCADLLLIALTGWGQEHDRRRSRAAGFDHHVVKPPDLDALRALLGGDQRAGTHPAWMEPATGP